MGRILIVSAGVTLPAVVAVIGCVVDSDRYPGIENAVPNGRQGGGSSSITSSSSSSSGGAAPSVCQCAATFASADGGACVECGKNVAGTGGACFDEQTACTNDAACQDAIGCIVACAGQAACIEGCIEGSPVYQALATCQCTACAASCTVPSPLPCNLGGGGTGGAGTGDAGTGGTGP